MESGHAPDKNVEDMKHVADNNADSVGHVADNKRHSMTDVGYVADTESSSSLIKDKSNLKIGAFESRKVKVRVPQVRDNRVEDDSSSESESRDDSRINMKNNLKDNRKNLKSNLKNKDLKTMMKTTLMNEDSEINKTKKKDKGKDMKTSLDIKDFKISTKTNLEDKDKDLKSKIKTTLKRTSKERNPKNNNNHVEKVTNNLKINDKDNNNMDGNQNSNNDNDKNNNKNIVDSNQNIGNKNDKKLVVANSTAEKFSGSYCSAKWRNNAEQIRKLQLLPLVLKIASGSLSFRLCTDKRSKKNNMDDNQNSNEASAKDNISDDNDVSASECTKNNNENKENGSEINKSGNINKDNPKDDTAMNRSDLLSNSHDVITVVEQNNINYNHEDDERSRARRETYGRPKVQGSAVKTPSFLPRGQNHNAPEPYSNFNEVVDANESKKVRLKDEEDSDQPTFDRRQSAEWSSLVGIEAGKRSGNFQQIDSNFPPLWIRKKHTYAVHGDRVQISRDWQIDKRRDKTVYDVLHRAFAETKHYPFVDSKVLREEGSSTGWNEEEITRPYSFGSRIAGKGMRKTLTREGLNNSTIMPKDMRNDKRMNIPSVPYFGKELTERDAEMTKKMRHRREAEQERRRAQHSRNNDEAKILELSTKLKRGFEKLAEPTVHPAPRIFIPDKYRDGYAMREKVIMAKCFRETRHKETFRDDWPIGNRQNKVQKKQSYS